MPTADEFSIAKCLLVVALDELEVSRTHVDSIVDTGIVGGTLDGLVDDALTATRANMEGLAASISAAIELCEHRGAVCQDYADRYAEWERNISDYSFFTSNPSPPRRPAPWARR